MLKKLTPILSACMIGLSLGALVGSPIVRALEPLFPFFLHANMFVLSMMLFEISRGSEYSFKTKLAINYVGIYLLLNFFLRR